MQLECIFTRFCLGTTLANAEIFRSGGNSLPCGIARAAPGPGLRKRNLFPTWERAPRRTVVESHKMSKSKD